MHRRLMWLALVSTTILITVLYQAKRGPGHAELTAF